MEKARKTVDGGVAEGDTGEIRKCQCAKSNCANNYCPCNKAGRFCSRWCRCHGCKNMYLERSDHRARVEDPIARNDRRCEEARKAKRKEKIDALR